MVDRENLTSAEHRAQIVQMAHEALAEHVAIKRSSAPGLELWNLAKPQTWVHGSIIVAAPGAIIVYGDVGEVILRPSDRNAMAWLRGAVDSVDYLLGKVAAARQMREFMPGDARDWLAEIRIDNPKLADAVMEHDFALESEEMWREACFNAGVDDPPGCTDWSCELLWLACVLQKFIEKTAPVEEPA